MHTAPGQAPRAADDEHLPGAELRRAPAAPRGERQDARRRSGPPRARPALRPGCRSPPRAVPRECHFPGAIQCPSLAAWKLTVTSASHRRRPRPRRSTRPPPRRCRRRPRARRSALIASIAASAGARGAPLKPGAEDRVDDHARSPRAPRRALRRRPRASARRRAARGSPSRRPRARPAATAGAPRRRSPVSASARAATSPSPPLLPFPHTTLAGPVRADLRGRLARRPRRRSPSARATGRPAPRSPSGPPRACSRRRGRPRAKLRAPSRRHA